MIKTVQRAELSGNWSDGIKQAAVEELNEDLRKMDLLLRVEVRQSADGFCVVFTKESEE